ncbi:MAG: hypothetical protein ACPHN3_07325 [Spongiibacter sp.]|uniref:Antitoxin Xre/MbcA/ParS-like toxin-binding domain-containing protein n=1 Tax=Spongiibacter thalassae TaxID=2721624 RepID=A0ABX1GE23_9GAMM|nr:hypothetical protein [Spongiibacter thalassae]NKI16747.1 hypothetical protein [Spongiibacter thalassae]
MSIGSWTPESEKAALQIDTDWLNTCIAISESDALDKLPAPFSESEQQHYSAFMRLPQDTWQQAVADLNNDQLIQLIRFFTVAEERISGWEAGAESPAIWINKVLRQRGEKLSTDMLRWIRANSRNRFIPNGSLG